MQPISKFLHAALAASLLLTCLPQAAAENVEDLHRKRVMEILTKPIAQSTRAQWLAVSDKGRSTNAMLVDISLDATLLRIYRLRAIQALAFFPTKQTHQVLWQMEQWFEEHDIKSVNHLRGRLSDEGFALSQPPYVLSS